jgi:hypothetical protein
MLERYLHIRIDAKKKALDRLDESRNPSGDHASSTSQTRVR